MSHEQFVPKKNGVSQEYLFRQIKKQIQTHIPQTKRQEGKDNYFPLSFGQQRIWLMHQMHMNDALYNMCEILHIRGHLRLDILQKSLLEVIRRHEALRTSFVIRNSIPWQKVQVHCQLHIPFIDLISLSSSLKIEISRKNMIEFTRGPFDLTNAPLFRISIMRLDLNEHILMLNIHHIISDGWSLNLFLKEFATLYQTFLYNQPSPLEPLTFQYGDYASWQRQWLQEDRLQPLLHYWTQQLQEAPKLLHLQTDFPRPEQQSYEGNMLFFPFQPYQKSLIRSLSQETGCTRFMILTTAFFLLLYRYTGQTDLIIGTGIAHRSRPEFEELIGFFVNTLALRLHFSEQITGRQLLSKMREVMLNAYAHQDLPFEKIVEVLQPERNLSFSSIFQVACVEHQAIQHPLEFAGLKAVPLEVPYKTSKFDLTLFVGEESDSMIGAIEYNTNLFAETSIKRMLGHWQSLIEGLATGLDQPICALPLLSTTEREVLLYEWNSPVRLQSFRPGTVVDLFEKRAQCAYSACAIDAQAEEWNYQQLNEQANKLAHALIGKGLRPEERVGVCLPRSARLIICLLAILKAGGVYVPLDLDSPSERLQFMSRDAELTFLLTYQGQEQQKSKLQGKLLLIEQLEEEAVSLPSNNLCLSFHALQMAYIIYTSGSTGNPKGVMATHASLHNLIASQIEIFNICDNDRLLLFASPGFDASISETFIALCAGATLSIASKEETLPGKIETFIQENQISCITCTPTILALLDAHACPSLCKIISAGEQCPPALIEKWSRNRLFFNAYGPTEATVCSTIACGQDCFPLHGQRTTSIGRPIANVQVYILDKYAQPVPVGVLGEIYIGGMGITRGYLHNPILTATTFIPDSFSSLSGSRLYKTGDIGLYLPDGRIEIRGRNDRQVKLRGFRIELNEIELYLDRHPIVQKSAVILQRDAVHQFRIVAYILKQSDSITIDGNINIVLRTYLQQYLPEYMLPAFYIEVDNLPTTTNGKVNYSALLLSDKSQLLPRITFVPPRQGLEQVVAAIWQEVLNLPDVGAHDNFFDLGGHSLLMAQVHEKLQSQLQLDIAIIDLFKYTTIAKLVEYIQGEQQQESQELEDFEETFSLRREAGKKRFQHQLAHRKSEQGEKRDHQ